MVASRRQFSLGFLAAATAVPFAAQEVQRVDSREISNDLITPEVKRVGIRLRCLCGCAQTVGDCNMVGCHYSSPARERIRAMQKAGMSDDEIVADFVKREGIKALAAPPATGFNWFGYSAPFILGGLGAIVVGFVLKRMLRPAPVVNLAGASAVPATNPATVAAPDDRFTKAAAHDIENLED